MQDFLLFTGDDETALKREALDMALVIRKSLCCDTAFEIISADKDGVKPLRSLENFLNALDTPSFLYDIRGIWFKNITFFEELDGKKNNELKKITDSIANSLEAESSNRKTKVLINGPNLSKKNLLYKFFEKHGKVFEINKVKAEKKDFQNKLFLKIKEYLEKYSKTISFDAAEYIVATVGSDTGRLYNELDKVVAYTGNNAAIALEDCKTICSKTFDMASWTFSEAVAARDRKEAFLSLNILLDKVNDNSRGGQELSMLYSLTRKMKEILKTKSAVELLGINSVISYQKFQHLIEGGDRNTITDTLLNMHPYRAYKLYQQSLKFSEEFLSDIFTQLLNANVELVSGTINKRLVLENIIAKIC